VQCLQHAYKNGLADGALLKELGIALSSAGRYHDAVPVLRKAAAVLATSGHAVDREVHVTLGEALLECGELEAARAQWVAAAALAAGSEEAAVARAALDNIAVRLGEAGDGVSAGGTHSASPAVAV
jgi:Flp pilus assembly protein TadD